MSPAQVFLMLVAVSYLQRKLGHDQAMVYLALCLISASKQWPHG